MEPEVVMTMDADTAHRFWLGKVNVTVALARGQMKAKGPVAKILKLVPLTKPVFPRYRALLEEDRARGPARSSLMEAGSALGPTPLRGFKDFYQYASTTRVIAGRDLLELDRLRVPEGGRAAGLRRHRRGDPRHRPRRPRRGGRRRTAASRWPGVFDQVPQDSSTARRATSCAAAAKEAGADSFLAVGGGSVMDTAKVADAVFTHGGDAARAGGLLPDAARGRRHGPPARHRAARLHPHHRRHRQRGLDGGRDQGPRARRSRSRSPTSRSSRGWRSSTPRPRARCRRRSPPPRAWTR